MNGVFVRGMELPLKCEDCPLGCFSDDAPEVCLALNQYIRRKYREDIDSECPLLPLEIDDATENLCKSKRLSYSAWRHLISDRG